jgi:hypothetical protein
MAETACNQWPLPLISDVAHLLWVCVRRQRACYFPVDGPAVVSVVIATGATIAATAAVKSMFRNMRCPRFNTALAVDPTLSCGMKINSQPPGVTKLAFRRLNSLLMSGKAAKGFSVQGSICDRSFQQGIMRVHGPRV